MESKFKNYKSYLSEKTLNEIEPKIRNKFVAVLKLKYPKVDKSIENNKQDIINVIDKHNSSGKNDGYFELLDIKGIVVVLGIELPDNYGINENKKKEVSRYIGNYFSRKLYHNYGWNEFSSVENALFMTIEVKKIDE